jgi:hypothetical protein
MIQLKHTSVVQIQAMYSTIPMHPTLMVVGIRNTTYNEVMSKGRAMTFVDGIRHSDTCQCLDKACMSRIRLIRSCISQKGVLYAEQSKNITLRWLHQFTVYILSRIGQYLCTCAQGWGFGGVAERLSPPTPAYTPPAICAGLPHLCHCLL